MAWCGDAEEPARRRPSAESCPFAAPPGGGRTAPSRPPDPGTRPCRVTLRPSRVGSRWTCVGARRGRGPALVPASYRVIAREKVVVRLEAVPPGGAPRAAAVRRARGRKDAPEKR